MPSHHPGWGALPGGGLECRAPPPDHTPCAMEGLGVGGERTIMGCRLRRKSSSHQPLLRFRRIKFLEGTFLRPPPPRPFPTRVPAAGAPWPGPSWAAASGQLSLPSGCQPGAQPARMDGLTWMQPCANWLPSLKKVSWDSFSAAQNLAWTTQRGRLGDASTQAAGLLPASQGRHTCLCC